MPLDDEPEMVARLHALLAESCGALWHSGHRVLMGDGNRIVLQGEAGAPVVTVAPHRPVSDLARWTVTVRGGQTPLRPQVCGSVLGVLEAVCDALAIPAGPAGNP
jgi:hypothetical protein